jgi:opacity protein-like surface antigen
MSFSTKSLTAGALVVGLISISTTASDADLSLYVANVSFDKDANLKDSGGLGLRWGKSSRIIGGETSLLIARPERDLGVDALKANATALFYEGRLMVNIPLGQINPFVGVGFGAVTITSTNVPTGTDETLTALADLQTNSAFSYGGGARYALNDKIDLRLDVRQYIVFSVQGIAAEQVRRQVNIPAANDGTVKYNELSIGVSFKF